MRLAEVQEDIATALLNTAGPPATEMVGGLDPTRRFAVHRRHYAASVTRALVERFAATVWLVGSEPMVRAAAAFVRAHPPTRPCMAEYGDTLPAYLASFFDDALPPYVSQFAAIDWQLGRIAIEVDVPAITTLAGCDPAGIAEIQLTLQGGLAYVQADWSLDELVAFYLSGEAPDSYPIRREPIWLELRGSRGELSMRRLSIGEFTFRRALADGSPLGEAAAEAASVDLDFDPIDALPRLLADGVVRAVQESEARS